MTMPVNEEIRNRIRVAVAAFAYEVLDAPIMSDFDYDMLAIQIDPNEATGLPEMDEFFRDHFDPSTGVWIHRHPNLDGIRRLHAAYYAPRSDAIPESELAEIEDLI